MLYPTALQGVQGISAYGREAGRIRITRLQLFMSSITLWYLLVGCAPSAGLFDIPLDCFYLWSIE